MKVILFVSILMSLPTFASIPSNDLSYPVPNSLMKAAPVASTGLSEQEFNDSKIDRAKINK